MDWLDLLVVQGTLKNLLQKQTKKESSPAPQFESINFSVLSLLYGPSLTMTTGKRQPEKFLPNLNTIHVIKSHAFIH